MTARRHVLLACMLALLPMPAWAQDSAPEPRVQDSAPEPPPDRYVEAPLDAAGKAAVAGVNAFAIDLYKASLAPGQDLFLSPASVSTALGLAYRGARGTTAEEMRRAVHFSAPPAAQAAANAALLRTMTFRAPGRELKVANALWLQQGMTFEPAYLADMKANYGEVLRPVDFHDKPAARAAINAWVEGETADRIRELLHENDISDTTRAVLVNTIYLKAEWAMPFSPVATRSEPFTLLDGSKVTTPLMHQRARFDTVTRGGVQAIALPYRGGETEMLLFLPDSPKGLPKFEAKLTAQGLDQWVKAIHANGDRDTILTLPRFHLAWREDLKDTLAAMGMPTAMSDDADFGAMKPFAGNESPNPDDHGLQIKHVIHQTFLDVDEKGSEAAAATAVVMDVIVSGLRRGPPPPPPVIFRADRPFLLAIRDTRTGAMLFLGRVANGVVPPSAGN